MTTVQIQMPDQQAAALEAYVQVRGLTFMVFPRESSETGFCRHVLPDRINESGRPACRSGPAFR
jgi:hypothetical protein